MSRAHSLKPAKNMSGICGDVLKGAAFCRLRRIKKKNESIEARNTHKLRPCDVWSISSYDN